MTFGNARPLGVSNLLVLFVVSVILVEDVLEFPDPVLEVDRSHLHIIQMGVFELLPETGHGVAKLVHEAPVAMLAAILDRAASGGLLLFLLAVAIIRGARHPSDYHGALAKEPQE
ncbi:hypothetical protein KC317_g11966 [Hortaea werneckii]|nr:hypothetical protein KC317_g11966 [Hortaea werneckii]KAI7689584.1 hypothetical protein KC322_g11761 [Hortaea werneckii]